MGTISACERISMFRDGEQVPRFPTEPGLSSSSGWKEIKLEGHRLKLEKELVGVTIGYQICFNLGTPTLVTSKIGGRPESQLVQRGQISIASHGHLQNIRWEGSMDLLLVFLSTRLLNEFSAEFSNGRLPELVEHRGHSDTQIRTLLLMLQSDLISKSPAGSLYGEQLGTALGVYLMKRYAVNRPRTNQCHSGLPGIVLTRVLDYIEANLNNPMTLEQLAELAKISRFYFARLFRNSTGQSPAHYLMERRVEKARHLLTGTALSLEEVSHQTGFSSQSHLAATFRKLIGTTPSKYRLLAR